MLSLYQLQINMIKKMIGKIDGQDIIFTRTANDDWRCVIPSQLDGKYVIELKAYDEAGNMLYITDILFTVDKTSLAVKFEFTHFDLGFIETYEYKLVDDGFHLKMLDFEFHNRVIQNYDIERGWVDGSTFYIR